MNHFLKRPKIKHINKVQFLRVVLIVFGFVIIGRLFYVQIIRHEHYSAMALAEHIKKFEISAPRGIISLLDGNKQVSVVLNEPKYTIYADPKYIADTDYTASKLVGLIGGDVNALKDKLRTGSSRYVILAKKMSKDQANRVDALELKGIGKKETTVRTYPQGNLASQVLGFVNDDNQGQYGIEEYLNSQLAGKAGLEKAVTDVRGIPLALSNDNILKPVEPGSDITLTIDIGMQRLVEDVLKSSIDRNQSIRASAVIIDATNGSVKTMANLPTYDPSLYDKITDQSVFINEAVSMPWEPGSVIKPFIIGAAFNEGLANPDTSYYDPGYVQIEDRQITNAISWGAQTMTFRDIINKSLNTGAVFTLKTLGGGEINSKARDTWYKYLVQHYYFGKVTGIEQSGELAGYISPPDQGDGLTVRYSNMAFGQGMTVTPIQLVAAYASILNGGIYYQPTLIATQSVGKTTKINDPKIINKNVISTAVSTQIREMLKNSLEINNRPAVRSGYDLGGKSGTAQKADSSGNYRTDAYDGTYIGYIGGADGIKYVMMVRLDEPKTPGFASAEAAKVWAEISNKLIDNFAIRPKTP